MKKTLLEIVQKCLNDISGDTVNSISDTTESLQLVEIVEDTYNNLMAKTEWKIEKGVFSLESVSSVLRPNYLKLPDAIEEIGEIKYNKQKDDEDRLNFQTLIYVSPVQFIDMTDSRNETLDNIVLVEDFDGTMLKIINDKAPTYWTSFDDKYIVFDSWDSAVESTMQGFNSKTIAAKRRTTFLKQDNFVPDLPEDQFPLLIAMCKKRASQVLRQVEDPGASEDSLRLTRIRARKSWKARGGINTVDYGRKGQTSMAPVRNRNPYFDKT